MDRRPLTPDERADAQRLAAAWQAYKQAHPHATQEWLATQTNIGTQGAIGQYLRGVIPLNLSALIRICKVIGVGPADISHRLFHLPCSKEDLGFDLDFEQWANGEISNFVASTETEFDKDGTLASTAVRINRSKAAASTENKFDKDGTLASTAVRINPYAEEPELGRVNEFFSQQWLALNQLEKQDLVVVRMPDESMSSRIRLGDTLLVDRSHKTIEDGGVFVLQVGDQLRIKRLFTRVDGTILVRSDNPAFPEEIVGNGSLQVVGRVVGLCTVKI